MALTSTQIEIFFKNNADKFDPSNSTYIQNYGSNTNAANNPYYEMINKLISLSNINLDLFKSMIEGFVLYSFSMDNFI